MYQLLLISKYLRRKLIVLFALMGVALCTAMVIIVISVMGGFLDLMRDAAQTLTGDVTIRSDITGFPAYEDLLEQLRARPEVAAATAQIKSYGLIKLRGRVDTIEVLGVRGEQLRRVTGYGAPPDPGQSRGTLYWTSEDLVEELRRSYGPLEALTPELREQFERRAKHLRELDLRELSLSFEMPEGWSELPAIVPGIHVNPYSRRATDGSYAIENSAVATEATLTVLPLSTRGTLGAYEPESVQVVVVNEFKSGLWDIDANRIYAPFDLLQRMLKMDAYEVYDEETGEPTGEVAPSRATEVMVRGAEGVGLAELHEQVQQVVRAFTQTRPEVPPLFVETWEQRHGVLLSAVEREKVMLVVLFSFISVVAVFLIGVIFYMIVLEKTRDIGTLRAIGASRAGIASIFLGYGVTIGVIGAGLGLGLAATVVWNINELQQLLQDWFGIAKMWDPSIYYYDRVPDRMDGSEVTIVVVVAIVSSMLGSVVPAVLAALRDPVEALRYE
jgi:lipoprotein-releasing system permease protein